MKFSSGSDLENFIFSGSVQVQVQRIIMVNTGLRIRSGFGFMPRMKFITYRIVLDFLVYKN